ncbi:MAG: DUF362 domain-containing protein [Lentisphaeria bacterium]|nr:DUF362 domain-containing protein [Lentisphaeria bacterium]
MTSGSLVERSISRRRFLAGSAGVLAAPLVVPHVYGAPSRPDMVVVRGNGGLDLDAAAYERMKLGFERMGGLSSWVRGKRVLLKINATERSSQDANTSTEACRALLRLCREAGAETRTVLGQEWGGFDSVRAQRPTLRALIKEDGAELMELPHYWVKGSESVYSLTKPEGDVWHELWVAKAILEPDTVLINLARLKSHPHCVFTGCVKNVIGLTRRMYGFHKVDDVEFPQNAGDPADSDGWHVFARKLAHAFRDAIGPRIALHVLDAGRPTFGWRGPAPERIHTFEGDTTVVGTDALAMDVFGCGLLYKQRPDIYLEPLADWGTGDSPYVKGNRTKGNYLVECGRLGVGQVDLAKVDIEEAALG